MYRNAYQGKIVSIFYSVGSKPLAIWETHTENGYITRSLDPDLRSMVLEIGGTNVSTTYMICPKGKAVLGITMPFLVMIVKNLKKYFSFEITILDDTGTRRRFRVSNFQSSTSIQPLCTAMPICLSEGWNQIQFNLSEFTQRAYKKQFVEVQKVKINANIRLRRIYFSATLIPEDQLPPEYKLYFPITSKAAKSKAASKAKEAQAPQTPEITETKEGTPEENRSKVEFLKAPSKQDGSEVTAKTASTEKVKDLDKHSKSKDANETNSQTEKSTTNVERQATESETVTEQGSTDEVPTEQGPNEQGATKENETSAVEEKQPEQQAAEGQPHADEQKPVEAEVQPAAESEPASIAGTEEKLVEASTEITGETAEAVA